jgi:hypothetical protein
LFPAFSPRKPDALAEWVLVWLSIWTRRVLLDSGYCCSKRTAITSKSARERMQLLDAELRIQEPARSNKKATI